MEKNDLKIAIIFHGIIHRSLKYSVESFRKHILLPLSQLGTVDIYFHSWDLTSVTSPRAGENEVKVDPTDVFKFLPEALGKFDSQSTFDDSINWENLFKNNPLEKYIPDEVDRKASLKNLVRSVESQERAWAIFQNLKKDSYDIVVAIRPDVYFIHDLIIPKIQHNEIYIPTFHSWGGVNDRFAIGGEKEIGIWFNKKDSVLKWIKSSEPGNSERMTSRWLINNNLNIKLLNFVFKRVRATGEIQQIDLNLSPPI